MNEPFFRPRQIELALEPPFTLGRIRVSPAALELRWDEGSEALEPRVMQVLVALHRHAPESVSRDDLSQLCWGGRIVGDDALNRAISRLRKALAPEPGAIVDTIPKVGYRLRLDPARTEAKVPAKSKSGRMSRGALWAGLIPAAAIVAAATLLLGREDPAWTAETMQPLPRGAAVETSPALSPDGRFLVYASAPEPGAPRDLYMRGLATGDNAALRLTSTGEDESSPAWSPDGLQLAFIRQVPGRPCQIVVAAVPRGTERIAGHCRSGDSTLSWLDDGNIIFSDQPDPAAARRLFSLSVANGAVRPLTNPPDGLNGDGKPRVSPDGRRIAFRRSASLGNDDIFILDVASGEEWPLTSGGWKAYGFTWAADSRTLFFTSNRKGDFGLWSIPVRKGAEPARISLGLLPFGDIATDRQDRLAAELSTTRANLFAFDETGKGAALSPATGVEWDPDLTRDGRLVYASNASGTNEIWMKPAGAPPVRLTTFGGSYVFSPRWSPDGRRIAFVGVKGGRTDIYEMTADGSRLRAMTGDGAAKLSISWAANGELLYSVKAKADWAVVQLTAGGPKLLPGSRGISILRKSSDGRLFGRRAVGGDVLEFDRNRFAALPVPLQVSDAEGWAAGTRGIYWTQDAGTTRASLRLTDWSGVSRRLFSLSPAPKTGLAIGVDGKIVAPRLASHEHGLALLTLRQK
ncbi:MAG TPA: winged helix-turn-helix domain-containing protein [Allosphingosinicella sp.]